MNVGAVVIHATSAMIGESVVMPTTVGAVLYVGVFSAGIAYPIYRWLIETDGPIRTPVITHCSGGRRGIWLASSRRALWATVGSRFHDGLGWLRADRACGPTRGIPLASARTAALLTNERREGQQVQR